MLTHLKPELLKGMYFQLVDNQVLSTQGQPDVFNLHRPYRGGADERQSRSLGVVVQPQKNPGSS